MENNFDLFSSDEDLKQLEAALEKLDQLPDDDEAHKAAWPKYLADLVEVHRATLIRQGLDVEPATKLSRHLIAAQAHYLGGRMRYLPNSDRIKQALRDIEIYDQYNGGNSRELSEKYGVTQQRMCCIIREQHQLHRNRIQKDMWKENPI